MFRIIAGYLLNVASNPAQQVYGVIGDTPTASAPVGYVPMSDGSDIHPDPAYVRS